MRRNVMLTLTVMVVGLLAAAGCRDDDDSNNNTNNNNNSNYNSTDDHTVYQVQDPNHPNHLQVGDLVQIERVVVTAVDRYDPEGLGHLGNIWVQEPDGGPFSGVKVFNASILPGGTLDSIHEGDLVDVSGEVDEYQYETADFSVTEISYGSINVLGQADPLTPEVVTSSSLMEEPTAEQWEGVLVRLENVRVTAQDAYGVTLTGGAKAGDDQWDVIGNTAVDDCLTSFTGVLDYFLYYYLVPRSAEDVVTGASTDCATTVPEICDNDVDDDGDGHIDCIDWDCQDDPACIETECGDNVDNDGDGDTDCDDSDCVGTTECPAPVENTDVLCSDNMDNDEDNLVDCEDPSCHGHPNVTVCTETNCTDNLDNDLDGHTDCEDYDCLAAGACDSNPSVVEAGATACADGIDNDNNGFTDCADNSCRYSVPACREDTLATCTDNIDNDMNSHPDCLDFSCQYAGFCTQETSDASCTDGVDNDGDLHTDCDDYSCQRAVDNRVCEGNAVTCSDGLDNDGEGHTDCDDFACRCCPSEGDPCGSYEYVASTCLPCAQ